MLLANLKNRKCLHPRTEELVFKGWKQEMKESPSRTEDTKTTNAKYQILPLATQ